MKINCFLFLVFTVICVTFVSCGWEHSMETKSETDEVIVSPETKEGVQSDEIEFVSDREETQNSETPNESDAASDGQETVSDSSETNLPSISEPDLPGYVAPEGWYGIKYETGTVSGGDYKLTEGVMGLKVYYVEKKLGMRPVTWGYYTERLAGEVAYYQSKNILDYTGSVNLETWLSMGFTEEEWNTLGTYVSPVRVTPKHKPDEIIKIFIERAKEYLRTPFVVGASGKPGEGVDCSGLVLQCLYTVGVYPDGLDPVQHSTVEEYNSRLMWADEKFKRVPISELMPGDLVFYRRPWSDSVCHVAIYLGEMECIEALYSEVEILPLYKDEDGYIIKGCKRFINVPSVTD